MADLQNRTLICSVLFIDIVEYSRKPVVEQIQLKDRFNALLSDALRGVAVNDRIILDTGDGAAISFIGDPEDALFVGTGLRDEIASHLEHAQLELSIRMGINLGPVRLVKDINGQPNIIGDGINVAQRVMSFARPGQVLVSRSYYEVVSRLSDASSRLFSYEGSRTDKHIREHEVYAVGAIPAVHRRIDDTPQPRWNVVDEAAGTHGLSGMTRKARDFADHVVTKPRLATAIAVTAIVIAAFGARAYRVTPDRDDTGPLRASSERPHVLTGGSSAHAMPPQGAARQVSVAAPGDAAPLATPGSTSPPLQRVDPAQRAAVALAEQRPTRATDAHVPAREADIEPAVISLAIAPWGQVFVDGTSRGASPPLRELELSPGKHRIELRNAGAPSRVINVTAKPGERLRIKHKFN